MKKQEGIYGSIRLNKELYLKKFRELYNSGLNDTEISKTLGVSNATIHKWRTKENLEKNFEYKRNFDEAKYLELYNKGLNYSEIARCLNISTSASQDYGSSLGLKSHYHEYEDTKFTSEEFQVLLGTLLGDAYLGKEKDSYNACGHFAHSLKQAEYCKWKYEKLKRFCSSPKENSEFDKRTSKTYYSIRVKILSHPLMTKMHKAMYVNNKKIINKKLLSYINALGLAVWFMDDGYYDHGSYSICTNCFTSEDLSAILDIMLSKFNLTFSIQSSNNVIRLAKKDAEKFKDLVLPYIHSDCLYKLHINELPKTPLNRETPEMDNPVLNPQEIEENAERLEVMPNI